MPSRRSSNNNSTCGCLAIVAVIAVVIIIIVNVSGKNKTSSTGLQFLGADPHSFKTAQDLYTFPPKNNLSESEYTGLISQFNTFVSAGNYPEDASFRSVLLQLDGAPNLEAVNTAIEAAVPSYAEELQSAASSSNPDVQASFSQANSQYESGDYAKAAESYIAVLNLAPDHLDARNNLGLCDLHLGNNISAIMQFDLILAFSPKYLGAEQNLSVALERIGLTAKALDHANRIVESDSTLPMAQYNLGWFQTMGKNYSAAASAYTAALKLYPNYAKALQASALTKMASGAKPSSSELNALPKDEKTLYLSQIPHPLDNWVWWVCMVIAVIILIGLTFRALVNDKEGGMFWGAISTIGIIIAVIVFAVFFNTSTNFSTSLWCIVLFNVWVMISNSK